MSEREADLVAQLRARCAAAGVELLPRRRYPDDELLRMLCDVTPQYDLDEALASCQASLRALAVRPLPPPDTDLRTLLQQYQHLVRLDGVNRDGEPCIIVVVNRALQEQLLEDAQPFIAALTGLLEHFRAHVFAPGGVETVQCIAHVERGFRLSWQAVPVEAVQQLMGLLQDLYPNYASRILVVDLPSYLAWFVRFLKGMLDEVTANKIELVSNADELLRSFYTPDGLPSYYTKEEPPPVPLLMGEPSVRERVSERASESG